MTTAIIKHKNKQHRAVRRDNSLSYFNVANVCHYSKEPDGEMEYTLAPGQALPIYQNKKVTRHCVRQYRVACNNGELIIDDELKVPTNEFNEARMAVALGKGTITDKLFIRRLNETQTNRETGTVVSHPSSSGYGARNTELELEYDNVLKHYLNLTVTDVVSDDVMPRFWVEVVEGENQEAVALNAQNVTREFFALNSESMKQFREVKFPIFFDKSLESRKKVNLKDLAAQLSKQFGRSTVYMTLNSFKLEPGQLDPKVNLTNVEASSLTLKVNTVTSLNVLDHAGEAFIK